MVTAYAAEARTFPTLATRRVVTGVALGLVWGIVARLWMRFVTDEPMFTTTGTFYLLGGAALIGGCAGRVFDVRRRASELGPRALRAARVMAVACFVVMARPPGPLTVLTALFAALALSSGRATWARALFGVLAVVGLGLVVPEMPQGFGAGRTAVAVVLYTGLLCPPILAMYLGVAPLPDRAMNSR